MNSGRRIVRSPFIERTVYYRGPRKKLILLAYLGLLTVSLFALVTGMPLIVALVAVVASWLILTVGLTWREHDS